MIESHVFYGNEGQPELLGHLAGGNGDPLLDKELGKEGSVVRVKARGRLGFECFELFYIREFQVIDEAIREARSQGSREKKKEYNKLYSS